MKYPKISIVTVNYNLGEYLERTIKSVLDQQYPNLEYIIIDGGSTDGSVDIIRKYEDKLAYWVSEPDNGLYHAINKGFAKSTGEIMAWINSDDMYLPGALTTVADIFTQFEEIEWLTSNFAFIDEKDRIVGTKSIDGYNKLLFISNEMKWIQQESTFWKRSLWNKCNSRLNEDFRLAADYDLWSRFFQFGQLHVVSTCLSTFRIRRSGQKSLEEYDNYMEEVAVIRNSYTLNSQEKNLLNKYNKVRSIYMKSRFLRLIFRRTIFKTNRSFKRVPQKIHFNRFNSEWERAV